MAARARKTSKKPTKKKSAKKKSTKKKSAKKKFAKKKSTKKKSTKKKSTKKKFAKKKSTKKKSAKKKSTKKKSTKKKSAKKTGAAPAAAQPSARAQGKTVDDYISALAGWQEAVTRTIRDAILDTAPQAEESIKWGQPVWEHEGPFAYLKAHRNTVNFGFWRGAELEDPRELLEGTGDRMRHIKLTESVNPPIEAIRGFIAQAVALNDQRGDPTKRR